MSQQYEVVIRGHLPPQWRVAFDGMDVHCLSDGNTHMTGSLPDQSALYGLLMRLRDFGLHLVSVNSIDMKEEPQTP